MIEIISKWRKDLPRLYFWCLGTSRRFNPSFFSWRNNWWIKSKNKFNSDDKYWGKQLNNLTAKTVITNTERFPKVKLYVVWLALIPIWTLFCVEIGKSPLLAGYKVPAWMYWIKETGWVILFILCVYSLVASFCRMKSGSFLDKVSKLVYIF